MSAFTDWNGPGCGNGNTLPQVATLEQLLSRLNELWGYVDRIRGDLRDHVSEEVATTLVHKARQYIDGFIGSLSSALSSETAARTNEDNLLRNLINANKAAYDQYTDPINGVVAQLEGRLNQEIWDRGAAVTLAINTLTGLIDALEANIAAGITTNFIDSINPIGLEVKALIRATKGIIGKLYPDGLIDYRNMAYTVCPAMSVSNDTQQKYMPKNAVAILGVLSDIWDPPASGVANNVQRIVDDAATGNPSGIAHKPARAYIKYIDDRPFNAIIDMTFTERDDTSPHEYTGAIKGVVAKTGNRDYIVFGLYVAKSTSGYYRVYLGMKIADLQKIENHNYPSNGLYTYLSGVSVFIGGVNFLPMTPDMLPNSALTEITSEAFLQSGSEEFDKLVAQEIYSDQYRDEEGHGVAITDEANGILTIGNNPNDPHPEAHGVPPHQLEIFTEDRPNVTFADGSKYSMAFLEDLTTSIYWQRSVDIIVDAVGDLDDQSKTFVTVDGTGAIIKRDLTGTNVRGIYYVDPSSDNSVISGRKFNGGEVALVKYSTVETPVPDAYYNGILPTGNPFTGADLNLITGTATVPQIGTTIVDTAGTYAKITAIYTSTGVPPTFDGQLLSQPPVAGELFSYEQPAYYVYDLASDTWVKQADIPIPIKYISGHGIPYIWDITYEWGGPAAELSRIPADGYYYEDAYVIWTAAHENINTYPDFGSNAWSVQTLAMAGYRSADRQDEIDAVLEGIATTSPDYAANLPLLTGVQLPEGQPKTISNPAYIHHKPWVGTSILDGGSFGSPMYVANWYVDGGDFTSAVVPGYGSLLPPATAGAAYRNAIMRLWYGDIADMPEYISATTPYTDYEEVPAGVPEGIWKSFDRTLRWAADKEYLLFSVADQTTAGAGKIYKFIPANNYDSKEYGFTNYDNPAQYTFLDIVYDSVSSKWLYTSPLVEKIMEFMDAYPAVVSDWAVANAVNTSDTELQIDIAKTVLNAIQPNSTQSMVTLDGSNTLNPALPTLEFEYARPSLDWFKVSITSPRLNKIENDINLPMLRELLITTGAGIDLQTLTFEKFVRNMFTGTEDQYTINLTTEDVLFIDYSIAGTVFGINLKIDPQKVAEWKDAYTWVDTNGASVLTNISDLQDDVADLQTDVAALETAIDVPMLRELLITSGTGSGLSGLTFQKQTRNLKTGSSSEQSYDINLVAGTGVTFDYTITGNQFDIKINVDAPSSADMTALTTRVTTLEAQVAALEALLGDPTIAGTLAHALANAGTLPPNLYRLQLNTTASPETIDWA